VYAYVRTRARVCICVRAQLLVRDGLVPSQTSDLLFPLAALFVLLAAVAQGALGVGGDLLAVGLRVRSAMWWEVGCGG
jgi:hypothetical protein